MIVLAAIAIVLLALPQVLRKIWKDRERRRLADQFRQFLQNLVHALRIGMGFLPAMEYAAQEGQEPLVAHWRWFIHCLRVGKSRAGSSCSVSSRDFPTRRQWMNHRQ